MAETAKKVLFVNSEIFPYLPETDIATIGRYLPQGIQERKKEIRSFMPRYGCINERKNQLHEVIRLSGMNIIIGDVDRPLVIKVASISAARIQVYFIDNDERAIFFARGVLETVKKLRWAPDIIHCQGWISQLVPLYLKKAYKDDPIFSNSKIVLSLYDDTPEGTFSQDFADKVVFGGIGKEDIPLLEQPQGINLAKTAISYSDAVIMGSDAVNPELADFCKKQGLPVLEFDPKAMASGAYIDEYNRFYDQL